MIIVGLGNPGKEYANTPHNVGFMAVDEIAKNNNIEFKLSKKHNAMIGEGIISGEKSYLIKPLTYMNLSGNAVRSFVEYYNIDVESILIIYDDMDLPLGHLRIRKSGTSGGHKGMKSIIENEKGVQIRNYKELVHFFDLFNCIVYSKEDFYSLDPVSLERLVNKRKIYHMITSRLTFII